MVAFNHYFPLIPETLCTGDFVRSWNALVYSNLGKNPRIFFISWLQIDPVSHDPTQKTRFQVTLEDEALKNHTKAVLLAELVSMELFYGLEDLLRSGPTGIAQGLTSSKLYSLTDKDLLLHSAETLLEVQ